MMRHLHDIAGGAVLTAPSVADLQNRETRPFIEKYFNTGTGFTAEERLRLFHAIRDLTADSYGGWHLVTNLQSGGGLFAHASSPEGTTTWTTPGVWLAGPRGWTTATGRPAITPPPRLSPDRFGRVWQARPGARRPADSHHRIRRQKKGPASRVDLAYHPP
jgi:hypothetical protein